MVTEKIRLAVLALLIAAPFGVQAQFSYITNNGTATITRYDGPGGAVTIPGMIDGFTVTGIDAAFYQNENITSVTIPDSVTSIIDGAFAGCSNLISVQLPGSLTVIGNEAFQHCTALPNVTIPNGAIVIGEEAFQDCSGLAGITIPDTITTIGNSAFEDCYILSNVTLPESVTSMGAGAFAYCAGLTSITIPAGVTNFGEEAFSPCYNLTNATILEGVTTTGDDTFAGCTNLSTVTISDSVTNIGDGAFDGCTALAGITISSNVVSIGQFAFLASGLTKITIPGSVTCIGADAFSSCLGLGSVTIPGSVTNMGGYSFSFCHNLTNATINYGATSIGAHAFYECYRLGSVAIPASVTSIGTAAFDGCSNLPAITLAPGNSAYTSVDGVLFNASQTTLIEYPPGNIQTLYAVPNTVTTIAPEAFIDCLNLADVTMSSSVTNLGDDAFQGCIDLAGVYFEGGAPNTGLSPFAGDYIVMGYYLPGDAGWTDYSTNTLPTVELTGIPITATPLVDIEPVTVKFTSASVDTSGNAVTNWNWDFGDGSTSSIQNPSHTYSSVGNFSVALVETNNNGVVAAGSGLSVVAYNNAPSYSGLVLNGGFETGDLTGWTLTGNLSATAGNASASPFPPPVGNYVAVLQSEGSPGYLSQTLSTTAGTQYLLSFWLVNPYALAGKFIVSWNGTPLLDTTVTGFINWTNMKFVVSASGSDSLLQFGFQGDDTFVVLGPVSVVPAQLSVTGATLGGSNLTLNASNGLPPGTYYVLSSTNVALPLTQWTPISTNVLSASGNTAITVTNAVSGSASQQFYILQTQ
ncbi:MAG TPA: leucine-rich repeat protein [Verrucomicrobiae bacterium]|jgi:PKD repeat protein|nr:leucine-rich repeat protein [Verrucomicrobiae bacterium]